MLLLELRNLSKQFGGLTAIDDLSLKIGRGEIMGLIGPNGAGKTTTFNLISGVLRPTRGRVEYKGQDITGQPAYRLAAKGIVRTFQLATLIPAFSVWDNILLATHLQGIPTLWGTFFPGRRGSGEQRARVERASALLEFTGLTAVRDELARNLPQGYQKRLSVAMAVAAQPELLLLDEPMTGMNLEEIQAMMELIRKIGSGGMTILLVEHHMMAVMGLCRRLAVLNFGRKIAEGTPEEVSRNPEVVAAYLGGKR